MARDARPPAERLDRIVDLLAEQGLASLGEMRAVTGASEATARRDLDALAQSGLIERTRGGARLLQRGSSLDEAFERRRRRNARAKAAIAARAADDVPTGAALFLNDGSTMLAFAQELARRRLALTVATCGLNIAELLARQETFEVVVIGGSLRSSSFGTIGPLATEAIRTLHADFAFLGCDGFHRTQGVRSNSLHDAEVARAFASHADATVVLADASKSGNEARARSVGWDQVDRLVTDAQDEELEKGLRLSATDLVRVGARPPASAGTT
jgi:DeoR/GlpR family transcriptional regulator of sugar metabolism